MDMQNNLLNIKNSESYVCDVHRYEIGHSLLYVYAKKNGEFNNKENFFIIFSNVLYFEGPFHWDTANFTLGHQGERIQILNKTKYPYEDIPPRHAPKLLILTINEVTIKIVASHWRISKKNIPTY